MVTPDRPTWGLVVVVCWGVGVFSFDHFLGESDGTALGTRVHVQFRCPAEGGHPHVQPVDLFHMPMQATIPVIIIPAIIKRAQQGQFPRHCLPTMLQRNNVVRLARISPHPTPIGHTHRVDKTQHLLLIRISKPRLRIFWIKPKQPQILTRDMVNRQRPTETGELHLGEILHPHHRPIR